MHRQDKKIKKGGWGGRHRASKTLLNHVLIGERQNRMVYFHGKNIWLVIKTK